MTAPKSIKPDGLVFVRLFYLRRNWIVAWAMVITLITAGRSCYAQPHPLIPEYGNVLVTYACHAKSIWHDEADGGYWGDGLDAKNQNGAVRGTVNTLLTYAMLVKCLDEGWLHRQDVKTLRKAGLNRDSLIKYIRLNLSYLVAHHKSANIPVAPAWGYHWQSSLWMQAIGMGSLLTWNELGDELKAGIKNVAAAEADWGASHKPRSMEPGNTAAEENAWDTGAPSVALAIYPEATSASLWMESLKGYAVNTYSHPEDAGRKDGVAREVSTTNLNSDWTLFNHNFFHPDYVQVSGMHLGEAWIVLKLGDALHGSNMAEMFEPYARHNVEKIWQLVMRPLLLPTGEFAYPSGNDWTYHCSTNQGYFAYIATAFGSYDAAEAEARGLQHVKNRREAGPPGRILGDSNLEWWWEPLVCKRSVTAMLHHIMNPGTLAQQPKFEATVDGMTTTVLFRDAKVWVSRTPNYFLSISYGKPRMGYFVPLAGKEESALYSTLPLKDGMLPDGEWEFRPGAITENGGVATGSFWRDGVAIGAVMGLEKSVTVFSRDGFGSISIENDSLTDPGRTVAGEAGSKLIPSLKKEKDAWFSVAWINVDEMLGLISTDGFQWKPAGGWNQKSVAVDHVKPVAKSGGWQLLTATVDNTKKIAETFTVESTTTGIEALVEDGVGGKQYRSKLADDGFQVQSVE